MKKSLLFLGIAGVCLAIVSFAGAKLIASEAKAPFGGEFCKALTAEDFAKVRGFKIASTEKPMASMCLYKLTGPAGATLLVFFDTKDTYEANRGIYGPVTAVSGLGEEAYSGHAPGNWVIAVKAKGYFFRVDDTSHKFTPDELKELAKDVLAKL